MKKISVFMLLFPLDCICFGKRVLVERFPLPRSTFNVKCLEILGSVSFLLSFIMMLKIVENNLSGVFQWGLEAKQLGEST